jgi:hypothetical protein
LVPAYPGATLLRNRVSEAVESMSYAAAPKGASF